MTRRYISIAEAAEYLNVSNRTVRRLIADGELTGYRAGKSRRLIRVDLDEIDSQLMQPIGPHWNNPAAKPRTRDITHVPDRSTAVKEWRSPGGHQRHRPQATAAEAVLHVRPHRRRARSAHNYCTRHHQPTDDRCVLDMRLLGVQRGRRAGEAKAVTPVERKISGEPMPREELIRQYDEWRRANMQGGPGRAAIFELLVPAPEETYQWRVQLDCGCVRDVVTRADSVDSLLARSDKYWAWNAEELLPAGQWLCRDPNALRIARPAVRSATLSSGAFATTSPT